MRTLAAFARRLLRDRGALALVEFGYSLPILVTLSLGGAEITNYVIVRMRVSQIALQVADNAARMGTGIQTAPKTVSETDINDVFAGAQLESNKLDLRANGRVILSDVQQQGAAGSNSWKIKWQRCYGGQTAHTSGFGNTGDPVTSGIGPTNQKVLPDDGNALMFVEVYYIYHPLVGGSWWKGATTNGKIEMVETASMSVRDRRDLTQIANTETASTC